MAYPSTTEPPVTPHLGHPGFCGGCGDGSSRKIKTSILPIREVFARFTTMELTITRISARLSSSTTYPSLRSISWPSNLTNERVVTLSLLSFFMILILCFHVRFSAPLYNAHHRKRRQKLISNVVLGVHVAAGVLEIFRWQIKACWSEEVVPDVWDLVLVTMQVVTSLRLAKYMRRGQPIMTRPVFQAGSVFRMLMSGTAWWLGSASLHKSSVATLNGFIYVRTCVLFLGPLIISKHGVKPKYPEVYTLTTYTAVVIAVSEVEIPHATKLYTAMIVLTAALNRWVTEEIERKDIWSIKRTFLHALASCGFAELVIVNRLAGEAAEAPAEDTWTFGSMLAASSEMKVLAVDEKIDL